MTRVDWINAVHRLMGSLAVSFDVWEPSHREFLATAQERLRYSPWEYVLSLTDQAMEELRDRLDDRLRADERADLDPELSRVTPQIPVAAIYRDDCPTCHGRPLGEVGCVACPTCGTQYGGC